MRGFSTVLIGALWAISAHAGVYEQALGLYNRTDYKAAAAVLSKAPEDARSLTLLGRCYLMDSDLSRATTVLEKAAALAPADSMTLTWLARVYGRRAETSFAFSAMTYAVKTRQTFERAVKLDPRNYEAVNDLFEFYLQAPPLFGGGVDKARGLLPLIEETDPAEAYFARARIAEEKREFPTAEAQLRRAVQLAPHAVGRVLDLARFLSKQGRFEESEKTLRQAEAIAPAAPRILFVRAECYIRAKRNMDEARDLLKRYLAAKDLTPDDPPRAEALKLLQRSEGA